MPKKMLSQVVDYQAAKASRVKKGTDAQGLIYMFVGNIARDDNFGIADLINAQPSHPVHADIEYRSVNGLYFMLAAADLEAKADSVYGIFGRLLTELSTERNADRPAKRTLGVVLPLDEEAAYRSKLAAIPKSKFLEFGKMVDASVVFCAGATRIHFYSWIGFYSGEQPVVLETLHHKKAS